MLTQIAIHDQLESSWAPESAYVEDIDSFMDELNIDLDIENRANEICSRHNYQYDLMVLQDRARNEYMHYIISFVGDDEISTSDSQSLAPAMIAAGAAFFHIKLSMPDVGFSKDIGNYAEGFILMPITSECSFDAVNRRHKSVGIPYLLDHVKLKQLSAVRKQSRLDLDFESKYSRLIETASWVDKDWFTYPFHQMSLIISTAVFDFRSARNFPYLFKSEGGCGGFPPFMNLDTIQSALFHFNSGKSKEMIIEIMRESVAIQSGRMSPQDNLFLRGTHLAQMGKEVYNRYLNHFKFLQDLEPEDREYWVNSMLDEDLVPAELEKFSATIRPDDYLIGSAISQLRNEGLVMTDLDVKISLMNQTKIDFLLGKENIGSALSKAEKEKKKNKIFLWKDLPNIIGGTEFLMSPEDVRKVLADYIAMHIERPFASVFNYQDRVKLYPASQVKNFMISLNSNLRSEVVSMLPISRNLKKAFKTDVREQQLTKAEKWILSEDMKVLIERPFPIGIGPDDSRITRGVLETLEKSNPEKEIRRFLIVTDDKKLFNDIFVICTRLYQSKRWILFRLPVYQYLIQCNRTRNRVTSTEFPTPCIMFNWFSNQLTKMDEIERYIQPNPHAGNFRQILSIYYDTANICRKSENFILSGCYVGERTKGFIPRDIFRRVSDIACLPEGELKSLPFWNTDSNMLVRTHYEMTDRSIIVRNNDHLNWRHIDI